MYKKRGLNETLTFFTDDIGKNLISFSYNLIDYEYLATKEKSAKTRRLMTTPAWEGFKTQAEVNVPNHGSRPSFGRKNYDSKGHEKKEVVKESGEGGGVKKEEEQSWLSKYWLYIMMAFLILPRFFEGAAPEGGEGGSQAGAAAAAPPARR